MQAITERGEAEAPPASAVRTTSAPDLSARSQDVLDTLLPWGQRRFGDALQILPECEATRIRLRDGSPEAVECRLSDERKLRIQTDVVVLAAGALGSPRLLRESGIRRNVGRRFSFDLTTTLFADFGTPLGRSDGAQLLAAPDPDDPYFVVETVWHPLWLLAMVMPGLFEQHAHNMERRDCILPVRVHVGINRDPTVAVRFRKRPRTVDLETDELQRLVHRMHNAGQLLFDGGAACLLPTTVAYTELCEPSDLDRLLEIGSADELSVTARPQGGAPISVDPKRGVVGPDLAVHGHRGLYVCDASVFPESVTRAPNLAAMALAEYAAEGMA
jgi:hypothetical protein